MKKIVTLSVLVFLAACNSVPTNDNAAKENVKVVEAASNVKAAGVQLKDDKLNALYQQYQQLTTALIKGDAKEARFTGNAIEAVAGEMKGGESLGASAARISATAGIEEQRAAFSTLSNNLLMLVKKSGVDTGQLYVYFCPMALNDKGAFWLSIDSTIQNPYLGEKMLTCGEIKETIRQNPN